MCASYTEIRNPCSSGLTPHPVMALGMPTLNTQVQHKDCTLIPTEPPALCVLAEKSPRKGTAGLCPLGAHTGSHRGPSSAYSIC